MGGICVLVQLFSVYLPPPIDGGYVISLSQGGHTALKVLESP